MTDNQEVFERSTYLDERRMLVQAEWDSAKSFDKTIVTLSAGALALSLTFVREIAPQPGYVALLFLAWGAFGISLLLILLSFLFGQYDMRRQREIVDEMYESQEDSSEARNGWCLATGVLNTVSLLAFLTGVVFLAVFAACNLKEPSHEDPSQRQSQEVTCQSPNSKRSAFTQAAEAGTAVSETAQSAQPLTWSRGEEDDG